jgi:cyanophycin synthetase
VNEGFVTMSSFITHPLLLRGLSVVAMARAYARYRNPRRRAIGRHHSAFYERVWREAAAELGATCRSLGGGLVEMELDGVRTRALENTCSIDDAVTLLLLADKHATYRVLEEEGLPTPRHASFTLADVAPALAFMARCAGDCVVKPAAGTGGGRGVTTGIRTRWQFGRAAATAAVYGEEILIEEQVAGENFRLLYLDGELVHAFVRRHPAVVGDGRSSVAKLVRAVNDDRSRHGAGKSQVLLTTDLDMRRTLAKQGLSMRSVPEVGRHVILKTVVNENGGADNTTVVAKLCPSIVADGARALRALGARLAGVDVITPDPTKPLAKAGGVILEVNAPPNYYYHYQKADGCFRVAVHVLKRLLVEHAAHGRGLNAMGALA